MLASVVPTLQKMVDSESNSADGGIPPAAAFDASLRRLAASAESRFELWSALLNAFEVRHMAEIGVYRGDFARSMLDRCPAIQQYWMVDPWRHLPDWNKPANTDDRSFENIREAALAATERYASRRLVLRGRTIEVIDEIADASLDAVYIDGDHTLRGICIDLIRTFDKVRENGWIGGDDFVPSIWQHRSRYEPTLIFPFAVHFAEAKGVPIFALPFGQFLICKNSTGFAFVDLTGKFKSTELAPQLGWIASTRRKVEETSAYWQNAFRRLRR